MEFILLVICSLAVLVIWFLILYWWAVLIVLAVIALCILIGYLAFKKSLDNVVIAEIISRTPRVDTISEKTGHTKSYGRYFTYHEHYKNKDIIVGYTVKFAVVYKSGKTGTIMCKEGGGTYNKLLSKVK